MNREVTEDLGTSIFVDWFEFSNEKTVEAELLAAIDLVMSGRIKKCF